MSQLRINTPSGHRFRKRPLPFLRRGFPESRPHSTSPPTQAVLHSLTCPNPNTPAPACNRHKWPSAQASGRSRASRPAKKERKEPLPVYVPKVATKLPDIKMSPKTKRMVLLIALIVIVISASIAVPVVITRDTARAAILGQMDEIAPFAVDANKAVSLAQADNSYLVVAAGGSVAEEDMVTLFNNFCLKRASILKLKTTDFNRVYKAVSGETGHADRRLSDRQTGQPGCGGRWQRHPSSCPEPFGRRAHRAG